MAQRVSLTCLPNTTGTARFTPACPGNLTLDGLEKRLAQQFPKTTTTGRTAKINFVRFADDFIVTGSSQKLLEQEVKPILEQFLQERGLSLSPQKTTITHIEDGFDFLGQNIRKYKEAG
jgi:RNA-directed DNA polymerase